ncbi:MAG: hypothetical protein EA397_15060 [Deltaproteobacteria bacterium]|nr:MAG: hypothetical protein EA397_15060 [Deltaproteobacteria bacterium]
MPRAAPGLTWVTRYQVPTSASRAGQEGGGGSGSASTTGSGSGSGGGSGSTFFLQATAKLSESTRGRSRVRTGTSSVDRSVALGRPLVKMGRACGAMQAVLAKLQGAPPPCRRSPTTVQDRRRWGRSGQAPRP